MLIYERTNSENKDFVSLVALLDADLAIRDGADHAFYSQFNTIAKINYVIVMYNNREPVGCGAIKPFSADAAEVKRMFVIPEQRGKGIAQRILSELERWAQELGFKRCVLETGRRQPEAIALYQKCGYYQTENYGQYAGMENSVCFEKRL